MISLNPSGFACSFNEAALENLSNENGGKKTFQLTAPEGGGFIMSFHVYTFQTLYKLFGLLP